MKLQEVTLIKSYEIFFFKSSLSFLGFFYFLTSQYRMIPFPLCAFFVIDTRKNLPNSYFRYFTCMWLIKITISTSKSFCLSIRPSVRVSENYLQFLQVYHKMPLIKVVQYVLRVKSMHFWSLLIPLVSRKDSRWPQGVNVKVH